jgi:hypothetical protein
MTWDDPGSTTHLRLRPAGAESDFGPPLTLAGAPRAYSLAWVAEDAVAVLLANDGLS